MQWGDSPNGAENPSAIVTLLASCARTVCGVIVLTSLRLINFKNFADETLKLGPFTVIVGANASGKSNIRDAFRFVHGIGRGYALPEIFGGKVGAGGQMEWEPIRGAPNEILRQEGRKDVRQGKFTASIGMNSGGETVSYTVDVGFTSDAPSGFRLLDERTMLGIKPVLGDRAFTSNQYLRFMLEARPSLALPLPDNSQDEDLRLRICSMIASMHFLDLSPAQMREPSIPGAATLGDYGQNLPSVLESICADADRKYVLASWLQELTPMDVQDFEFPRDPSGRVHLRIVEHNGRQVSAYSASDGTLKFLALLALLLNEDPSGTYFFEDIDAGIHPNRLWLLLELIEKQTAKGNIQVIATTHSPALLGWMNDTTFEHTSIVYRDEDSADGIIRPVSELPNIRELRSSQGLGRLLTSGWMEDALALTQMVDGGREAEA